MGLCVTARLGDKVKLFCRETEELVGEIIVIKSGKSKLSLNIDCDSSIILVREPIKVSLTKDHLHTDEKH